MFLSDRGVGLRAIKEAELPLLANWRNDADLRVRTREFRPLTIEDQRTWFERIQGPNRRDFMFMVEAQARLGGKTPVRAAGPLKPIGVVGLCHWEPRDRTAEVSFYLGEQSFRGKGIAIRALELLHGWGFAELGLDRIWAECYEFNQAGLALLKSLGYVEEGRLRKHVWRQGGRVDSVMLGLLREEWRA